MKLKNQGLIAILLLALLFGWVAVALIWPWLQRTFSEPSLSLAPVLSLILT